MLNNTQKIGFKQQQKTINPNSDSENDSDKTKDTMFQARTQSYFKILKLILEKTQVFLSQSILQLISIFSSTSLSDKAVRLTSAIIKFVKNFELISKLSKFDKLTAQITQLRRILRVNRMLIILKDYAALAKKQKITKRDIFEVFFKTVMLICDINDMLAYLMQLGVFKEHNMDILKKNVANFYFIQCVLWVIQHVYDYFTKSNQDEAEKKARRINIVKYLMDTLVSHNDFSGRKFSIGIKDSCLLGLSSSLIGIFLIWK